MRQQDGLLTLGRIVRANIPGGPLWLQTVGWAEQLPKDMDRWKANPFDPVRGFTAIHAKLLEPEDVWLVTGARRTLSWSWQLERSTLRQERTRTLRLLSGACSLQCIQVSQTAMAAPLTLPSFTLQYNARSASGRPDRCQV